MPSNVSLPHMIGRTVSHFRIREKLCGCRPGVVCQAEGPHLVRAIALQCPPGHIGQVRQALRQFKHEAEVARATSEPFVYPWDEETGRAVSEYEGEVWAEEA